MQLVPTRLPTAFILAVSLGAGLLVLLWVVTTAGQSLPQARAATGQLLAIYALAFDNDPASTDNLTAYYTPTLQALISATVNAPQKTAVVLADLDDFGDTRLLIVKNGIVTPVAGLPIYNPSQATVSIDPNVHELDMADGSVLGALLLWARQLYPADATLFSFVGHGAPLAPAYRPSAIEAPTPAPGETPTPLPTTPSPLDPLPPRWAAHAGLTDFHSASLLAVRDLANALRIGTNNGQNPMTVLDLLHCFSASIEELYEVHDYATTVVASPNYAYSQPEMLGAALANVQPTMPATELSATLVQTYDALLPVEGHPRLLVAMESAGIAPIKEAWDRTSYHVYQALNHEADARVKLAQAYAASAKYDTTLCADQDWRLQPPDALSDLADFAGQLGAQFGPESPVSAWAITTTQRISAAITTRAAHDGSPWFVETTPVPVWNFHAPGISLFTDFAPSIKHDIPHFSWQARWYTDTATSGNRYPFAFIQGGYEGVTWADVFSRFWSAQVISTTNCLPSFIHGRGAGELSITQVQVNSALNPITVTAGMSLTLSATVQAGKPATNPLLRFTVYQAEKLVFSDVVGTGYLPPESEKTVQSRRAWQPATSGIFQLAAVVDVDDRFIEGDEGDNTRQLTTEVYLTYPVYLPIVAYGP